MNDWWIRVVRGCDYVMCAECGEWILVSEAATSDGEPVCAHHFFSRERRLTQLWARRSREVEIHEVPRDLR